MNFISFDRNVKSTLSTSLAMSTVHSVLRCFLLSFVLQTALTIDDSRTSIGTTTNVDAENNVTSDPRNSSDLQTTVTVDESLSIQCGETKTGTIGDSPHSVLLHFVNLENQDVTFTDCDTEFDSKLFLIDSNGTYIQNQSTNHCDGNDCDDVDICSTPNRETFTIQSLDEGSYSLELTPYTLGGTWTVNVICPAPSIYADDMTDDDLKC